MIDNAEPYRAEQTNGHADDCADWPEPQSLKRMATEPEPYPLEALPDAMRAAVIEYQGYGQQSISMVASSALAVVSLAAQGLADVARDDRLRGPLSLNFLIVAPSGERKTAADRALGAMLTEWERGQADALRELIKRNRAALQVWMAEGDGIRATLREAAKKHPEKLAELRERLEAHELAKPAEIIAPRLRYEDVNPQSLAYSLAKGHPSAALWSDEAGMVTGSLGMGKDSLLGFMATLNRLWDGGSIHHDRKQAESVHLEGRRLTVSLMAQPSVLRDLASRSAGLTRGSGFLARFLVAEPVSTMGTRMYREPPKGMPALSAFHRHIRELLDVPLPLDGHGRLTPAELRFSPQAASIWRTYHDEIERQLAPLGALREIPDFAAKSAENAARIAGCLHVYDSMAGAIPPETMQAAVTLVRWYLGESLRVLALLDEPQDWSDARALDVWLAGRGGCTTREAQQYGPVRDKARRDAALAVLMEADRIRVEEAGRRKIIRINPALRHIATATPATSATHEKQPRATVARVATVAVATSQSLAGDAEGCTL